VAIHHVDVNQVGPSGFGGGNIPRQIRKIG
jgi:hypothetical protein